MSKKNNNKQKILSALAKTENYLKINSTSVEEQEEKNNKVDNLETITLKSYDNGNDKKIMNDDQKKPIDFSKIIINDSVDKSKSSKIKETKILEDSKTNPIKEEIKIIEPKKVELEEKKLKIIENQKTNKDEENNNLDKDKKVEAKPTLVTDEKNNEIKKNKLDINESSEKEEQTIISTKPSSLHSHSNQDLKSKQPSTESIDHLDLDKAESIDVSTLSHEQFVKVVKEFKSYEDKIKLMGRRIHFLNTNNNNLKTSNDELKEKSLKLFSNFENERKLLEEKHEEFKRNSLKSFVKEIIGTIDIFEMALVSKSPSDEIKNWLVGFKMIYNNLYASLEANGVKKMIINPGDTPDYNYHSIIEVTESETIPEGKVVSIKQHGYLFNGILLRAALITVAKPKSTEKTKSSK